MEARAALLLAIAALLRRDASPVLARRAKTVLGSVSSVPKGLELAALACALSAAGEPIGAKLVTALSALLEKPVPLPAGLGFDEHATTTLLLEIAIRAQPARTVAALLDGLVEDPELIGLAGTLLFGSEPLEDALVKSELSPTSVQVLHALAGEDMDQPEHDELRERLGFQADPWLGTSQVRVAFTVLCNESHEAHARAQGRVDHAREDLRARRDAHERAAKQRRARALYRATATAFKKAASLTKDPEDKRWLQELARDAALQAKPPEGT